MKSAVKLFRSADKNPAVWAAVQVRIDELAEDSEEEEKALISRKTSAS